MNKTYFGPLASKIWASCNEFSKWVLLCCSLISWKSLKPIKVASLHDELAIGCSYISGGGDSESLVDDGSSDQWRNSDSGNKRWQGYQQWRSTAVTIGGAGRSYTDKGVIDHVDQTVIIYELRTVYQWTNVRNKMRTKFCKPVYKRRTRNLILVHEDEMRLSCLKIRIWLQNCLPIPGPNSILNDFQQARMQYRAIARKVVHWSPATKCRSVKGNSAL